MGSCWQRHTRGSTCALTDETILSDRWVWDRGSPDSPKGRIEVPYRGPCASVPTADSAPEQFLQVRYNRSNTSNWRRTAGLVDQLGASGARSSVCDDVEANELGPPPAGLLGPSWRSPTHLATIWTVTVAGRRDGISFSHRSIPSRGGVSMASRNRAVTTNNYASEGRARKGGDRHRHAFRTNPIFQSFAWQVRSHGSDVCRANSYTPRDDAGLSLASHRLSQSNTCRSPFRIAVNNGGQ